MTDMREVVPLRSVIVGALVVCLMLAAAPWLSGGQDALAMMISGGALLLGALLVWRQPEVRRLKWGPLVVVWWLLIGFAALSLLWSASRYSSGVWITQWVMVGVAFWLAYVVAGEPQGREWLVRGYLVSVGVFVVVALWLYLTSTYDRLTGTFYWPNPAAAYLIPAILISVDRWRRAWGRAMWWWMAATVVLGACFLLTDSRAATLVLLVALGLYLLVSPISKVFWKQFVFVILATYVASFGLTKLSTISVHNGEKKVVPGSRFAEAAGESRSLKDRLYYLGSAFEIWFAHPLGGTGAGTYGDVHPQYQKRVVSAATSAHNVYVQTLAELGLVGAMLLAAVLLWLGVGVVRGFAMSPETLPLVLGAAGLLMHFGLDIDARYPALLLLVAVLMGAVFRQRRPVRWAARWWMPAVTAVLLVPLVGLYQSDVWAKRAQVDQEDGDYDLAVEHYAAAHRGVIYNPDYLSAEGINLFALAGGGGTDGKTGLALALGRAKQAQTLDRYDSQHYQLEGRVLAARGDLKGAEAAFRAALKLDPYNHPDYALDLAAVQARAGDAVGALGTARAMLAQYPQDVVDNRNLDAALKPALANLWALKGNLDLQAGRLGEAGVAARRALRLDPDNLRARALRHQVEVMGRN
jgi:O-antigen ligase/Flp pilus assembly protein TadD